MKKVNKTILLASTLFVASTLIGNTNAYADEENDVDLKNEQASDSKDIESLEDSSIDTNDEIKLQNEEESISLDNESGSEDYNLPEEENSVDNAGDTENIENTEENPAAEEEVKTEVPVKEIEEERTVNLYSAPRRAKRATTNKPVVNYDSSDLDAIVREYRKDKKNREDEKKAYENNNKLTWQTSGSNTYYKNNNGYYTKGFSTIEGKNYYFDNQGVLQKNKKILIDNTYYESDSKGVLNKKANTWVNIQNNRYRTDANGNFYKGLRQIDGSYYRFDDRGILQTNKKEIKENKFYLTDSKGRITNPSNFWFAIDGTTYRTGNDGKLVTGVRNIDNYTYIFADNGKLTTNNIIKYRGKFLKSDYRGVATNPKNEWVTYNNRSYHTNENGYIQEGVWNINGTNYYFDSNGIKRNTTVTQGGVEYRVDHRGVATPVDNNIKGDKSIDKTIEWMFAARRAGLNYSMHWQERVSDEYADCSSAVFRALMYGGFLDKGTWPGSTETLFQMGAKGKVMYEIDESEIRYGDIFVAGHPGGSLGADGHTGFILNRKNDTIIHMNYSADGVSITPRKGRMGDGRGLPVRYYRLVGASNSYLYENRK